MFIQLNEKNEIIASANFKFAEDAIETDKEIVRNWDGRLVFKGEETEKPEPSLEELKQEKIKELKQNCQNYIYSVYPVYKQMNIINPLSDYSNEDSDDNLGALSPFIIDVEEDTTNAIICVHNQLMDESALWQLLEPYF